MKQVLTEIEQKALTFIVKYLKQRGYPPTVREVSAALGYASPASGLRFVKALEEKGHIAVDPGPRALRAL